jgi:hypothetical protein
MIRYITKEFKKNTIYLMHMHGFFTTMMAQFLVAAGELRTAAE